MIRPSDPVLVCQDVGRAFATRGGVRDAVVGCSFTAGAGDVIGIVGANGAGKTTLLRLLAGDLPLTDGSATVDGLSVGTRAARRVIGYAPDPPVIPMELTGVEWLSYLAAHRAQSPAERLAFVRRGIELGGLEEFAGRPVAEYSRGMAQRLGLAAAAMLARRILLLDEALSGVDPLVGRRLRSAVLDVASSGRVVLVASHDLATIERLATRVLVLWRGRIVADVAMAGLLRERMAELSLNGAAIARAGWILERFRGAVRTGEGVLIPLSDGLTVESVLAACRNERIPVAASRVRYRALEDLLMDAVSRWASA
ncbi:MAG TPA: ABC transporter ATP-binding protein [Gemmatimonadales bacterium]|nr:ABC transporter ATP-binding protein [Gemmatimonadales bacterium]